MELIFFDLEFNQYFQNKKKLKEDFLSNEIIQISLIKTDLLLNPIRTFTSYIKMEKSNWLNSRVSELTGITFKKLQKDGKDLSWIIEYLKETNCFKDVEYLIAWGNSDMNILIENCIKKNIDCDFLKDINYIDAQRAYGSLNKINRDVSLIKACGDLNFYNHHNALHDVCRLIEVCKKEGITNIITEGNKNRVKLRDTDTIFEKYRYRLLNKFSCDCGSGVRIFVERNIYEIDEGLEKICLVKCIDCNKKYFVKTTIIKNPNKIESFFKLKEFSNEHFFGELNDIIRENDFKF